MEKKINATEKFCTRCGRKFLAIGREVICPSCKQAAAEDAKRAAVLKAKRASWTGESVPVRISGRASAVIRAYGAENSLPFAAALDDLLKASPFFRNTGKAWEDVTPYKSRRRDKHATETAAGTSQDAPQATSKPQDAPQGKPQEVKQAARVTKSATASKKTSSKTSSKSSSTKKG